MTLTAAMQYLGLMGVWPYLFQVMAQEEEYINWIHYLIQNAWFQIHLPVCMVYTIFPEVLMLPI